MAFYEWKYTDTEIYIYSRNKRCSEVCIYDQRCRPVNVDRKVVLGISKTPTSYTSVQTKTTPLLKCVEKSEDLEVLCDLYFEIKPKMIPMTSKVLCDQRKESFDQWLESNISLGDIFNNSFSHHSVEFRHLRVKKSSVDSLGVFSQKCPAILNLLAIYLQDFMSIQSYDSRLVSYIAIPLVMGNEEYDSITDQWIRVMSWWKRVTQKLLPLALKFREAFPVKAYDTGRLSKANSEKCEKILQKLKRVLRDCQNQQRELFLTTDLGKVRKEEQEFYEVEHIEVDETYEEVLLKAQRVSQFRELVEELIVFSTNVSAETIGYLHNVQQMKNRRGEYDEELKSFTTQELRVLNGKVRSSQARKSHLASDDFFLYVDGLLESIGKCLRLVRQQVEEDGRDLVTNESERFAKALRHSHELVEMLMEACDAVALDFLYSHFNIRMDRNFLCTLLKQYHRQVIQTCIQSIATRRHLDPYSDRPDHLDVVTKHFYQSFLATVKQTLEDCIPVVKPASVLSAFEVPSSVLYQDFPRYLRAFPKLFGLSPHFLKDMVAVSEARLIRLQSEMFAAFENNIEDVVHAFRTAEECVSRGDVIKTGVEDSDSN